MHPSHPYHHFLTTAPRTHDPRSRPTSAMSPPTSASESTRLIQPVSASPYSVSPATHQLVAAMASGSTTGSNDILSRAMVSRPPFGSSPPAPPTATDAATPATLPSKSKPSEDTNAASASTSSNPETETETKQPTPPTTVTTTTKPKQKRTKKYNAFNIFFMLERQLLLHTRGGGMNTLLHPIDTSASPLLKHGLTFTLPPLSSCERYAHLPLSPEKWFLEISFDSHNKKNRPHRKTHGMISFKELAQSVSKNYRDCDDDTRDFCNEIADTLGCYFKRVEQVEKKMGGKNKEVVSVEGKKKKKTLKRRKDGNHGVVMSSSSLLSSTAKKKVKRSSGTTQLYPHFELSQAEALTVQQLMGMKAHSPVAAMPPAAAMYRYPPASLPASYAQGAARGSRLSHPVHHNMHPPSMPPTRSAPHQTKTHAPQQRSPPLQDTETMILEMAHAIQARQESERRIELLQRRLVTSSATSSAVHPEEPPVRYSYPRPEYTHHPHHHRVSVGGLGTAAPARLSSQALEQPTEDQIAEYSYARYLSERAFSNQQAAAAASDAAAQPPASDREQLLVDAYLRLASSY